ncbi:MAG: hypothetical protein VCE12_12075 [Candidatus Latescibacterota bacterium]
MGAVSRRLADGDYRIWEDGGEPVSYAARFRPTATGMAINAVYTPKALRGKELRHLLRRRPLPRDPGRRQALLHPLR